MLKTISRLGNKFILFLICLSAIFVLGVPCNVNAQTLGLSIRQEVSTSSGQPGDVIQLLVYVQGMPSSIETAQVRGVLEYDTSLFTVQQVAGDGLGTASVDSLGSFTLSNSSGKSLENGDLIFHMSLLVKDGASVGKTTVCVNEIMISDTAGVSNQISNFVPSTINLLTSDSVEEPDEEDYGEDDENEEDESYDDTGEYEDEDESEDESYGDEKDYEKDEVNEDFDDIDDYYSLENDKDVTKRPNINKNQTVTVSKNQTTTIGTTAKTSATAGKAAKLDENYKTGAGFGNDIYLMVAGFMGLGGTVLYILRRKWMKDTHKYL